MAQALSAATRTVAGDRRDHSVHAYHVRGGMTNLPTIFTVSNDADGASTSFRRVTALQGERMLLSFAAAFQLPGVGYAHQIDAPQVPAPELLEDDYVQTAHLDGIAPAARAVTARASPIRFRSIEPEKRFATTPLPARQTYWFRLADDLAGADQALHRIAFTYASDMMLLGAALMPHGHRWFDGETRIVSLDHALWIHQDVRIDDWLLYQQESPWAGQGRGLNRGHIFDRAGRLVATVSQEGSLLRRT
jgi:acyl-CoA thioesterase-2